MVSVAVFVSYFLIYDIMNCQCLF